MLNILIKTKEYIGIILALIIFISGLPILIGWIVLTTIIINTFHLDYHQNWLNPKNWK